MDEQADDIQSESDGAGPKYHRVYAVDLPVSYDQALKTMREVMADPNSFSPQAIATFEKTLGEPGALRENDEFMVHITGPWNGPVRVSHVADGSFSLLTLKGHIEAGQIHFRLVRRNETCARFEIESVTRSRDQIVNFFYDKLRLAQFAQTEMWELYCKEFAQRSFKENRVEAALPEVEVKTERQDRKTGQWQDVSNQLGANAIS